METQIERADHLERSSLLNKPLSPKKIMPPIVSDIQIDVTKFYGNNPQTLTYLNINPDYRETFKAPPIIAFRENVSLKQIIGTKIIIITKVP